MYRNQIDNIIKKYMSLIEEDRKEMAQMESSIKLLNDENTMLRKQCVKDSKSEENR